jgi:pimeloyl-ACP methyl ester carboxylesterase
MSQKSFIGEDEFVFGRHENNQRPIAEIEKRAGISFGPLADLDALDQRATLAALDAPVLSIVGGKDVVVQPDICRLAGTIARHGTVAEFADSGHAPFIEEGPRYRQVLLDFLANIA